MERWRNCAVPTCNFTFLYVRLPPGEDIEDNPGSVKSPLHRHKRSRAASPAPDFKAWLKSTTSHRLHFRDSTGNLSALPSPANISGVNCGRAAGDYLNWCHTRDVTIRDSNSLRDQCSYPREKIYGPVRPVHRLHTRQTTAEPTSG